MVLPVPRIASTRYVAFGDSITEGKPGPAGYHADPRFPFPNAYAKVLYDRLTEAYTAQTIEMYDEGIGGEKSARVPPNDGVSRLPGVLTAETPQMLLLHEGRQRSHQRRLDRERCRRFANHGSHRAETAEFSSFLGRCCRSGPAEGEAISN
jgi:hypothetical protein